MPRNLQGVTPDLVSTHSSSCGVQAGRPTIATWLVYRQSLMQHSWRPRRPGDALPETHTVLVSSNRSCWHVPGPEAGSRQRRLAPPSPRPGTAAQCFCKVCTYGLPTGMTSIGEVERVLFAWTGGPLYPSADGDYSGQPSSIPSHT